MLKEECQDTGFMAQRGKLGTAFHCGGPCESHWSPWLSWRSRASCVRLFRRISTTNLPACLRDKRGTHRLFVGTLQIPRGNWGPLLMEEGYGSAELCSSSIDQRRRVEYSARYSSKKSLETASEERRFPCGGVWRVDVNQALRMCQERRIEAGALEESFLLWDMVDDAPTVELSQPWSIE